MIPTSKSAFDIGPLSWVKSEIEHSIVEMRSHLDALSNDPGDSKAAKYAATHLHQVTGALTMVGLGAAARYSEEIEKLVESLVSDPDARAQAPQRISAAVAATDFLSAYLDGLVAGEPDRPMRLARAYLDVNRARGAADASETDLFSPDLSLAVVMSDNTVALPKPEMLAEAIKQRRSMYQAGLLKLLRDKDLVGGAREMRNATLAIEALQVTSPTVSFWYTASGFFDAVATNPAEAGSMAVQLFGKIDQQIKLLVDGVQKIPEKLFRDLLLVIGRSKANTERLKRIRELYRLDELLAVPVVYGAHGADDKLKAVIRTLRDHVQEQKESWLRFASGNRASLEQFVAQSAPFYTAARQQLNLDLAEVVQTTGMVGSHLQKLQASADDSLALEMATALLFLESSLENYFRLSSDFRAQANNIIQRLKAAMTGAAPPPSRAGTSTLMGDISKRAQERMLMFQVGQEVQVNLATIEGALDAFFRDASKRAEVTTLGPLFSQVQGALTILELDDAAALNQLLRERVALFASGETAGAGEAADAVAEGVSALGLYISALQQGTSQPHDALLPALIRFGLVNKPVEPERTLTRSPISRADIDVAKQKVQERYAEWKLQPEKTSSRDQLREAVKELKLDATLVADSESARQSEEMLRVIDQTFDPHKTGLVTAVAEIAPEKPTKAPSSQTVQLMDASTTEVDSELLEIFLEEAGEVVATLRECLDKLRSNPQDDDALITIRRGYHTLKGSGRMVGLVDLGEVAWNCEQVLNKWLKDETPATAGLLGFVEHTSNAFTTWIDALGKAGNAPIDGSAIARMAEMLKNGEEPELAVARPATHDVITGERAAEVPAPAELVDTAVIHVLPTPSLPESVTPASASADAALPVIVNVPPADVSSGTASALEQPTIVAVPLPELPSFAPESVIAPEPADVQVGTIAVPHALFTIYLGEAEQHIATLGNELSALEARPLQRVSHDFMRAAHTLASSSRTTNFEMIAEVAAALEKWSHDAIEFSPALDSHRLGVMRAAVDSLGKMVMGLHTHELPAQRADLVSDLMGLREALKLAKRAESTQAGQPSLVPPPLESSTAAFDFLLSDPPLDVAVGPAAVQPAPLLDNVFDTFLPKPVAPVEPSSPTAFLEPADAGGAAALGIASSDAAFKLTGTAVPSTPVNPEPAFESGKEKRRIEDDVDSDLLPIFLEEARDIVPKVGDCTRAWRARPADHAPVIELARHLHTLKGSARMAGLMRLGELAHVIESQMIAMDADAVPDMAKFDQIDEYFDRFTGTLDLLHAGEKPATPIDVPVAHVFEHQKDKPATIAVMAAAAQAVRDEAAPDGRERQSLLRVNADIIDRFVNDAGELSIARSRIDQEMLTFKQSLLELTENISRMKAQVREVEIQSESQIQSRVKEAEERGTAFDPLEFDRFSRTQELTRFMAESLNDVVTLQLSLQKNLDETEAALIQQARLNRDLQQGLMSVRLVPLGNLQDRFYRLIRQTAKELGKKANLEFRGVRVEIDRSVLEKITSPFEHLLRNAVAHGLEQPEVRARKGKSEIGEITIDAQQVGNEVVLTLSDDGDGLDFARIREKAIETGLLAAGSDATETQLTQYIFMSGFSTAKEVTQVSGRGVGMDVVRNEILSLGGRIDIASVAGRGTTFTIALPLTLAVTQAVMVVVGEAQYAIPSVMIEQVQEYKGKRYEPLLEMNEIDWKGNKYPLTSMAALLGGKPTISAQRKASVILAKSGQQRAAVQVDQIIGNREIVVKSIGPQLARLVGVVGATVTGSGQIILIINPVQLHFRDTAVISVGQSPRLPDNFSSAANGTEMVGTAAPRSVTETSGPSLAAAIAAASPTGIAPAAVPVLTRTVPLVMVVDDSLTVRKITSRMLAREGFEVATAKDGVDALQQLQDIEPDLILLDIEMPRMDGFEFARQVRTDVKARRIPIIMITSRTADKHRNRAIELGVNEYMGKPYQEEQLLALIRNYTERAASG